MPSSSLALLLPLFLSLISPSTAQVPTAVVSIVSDGDYVTARPCIQTCLWYNGGLGRGGNSGFNDVGKALGCGQNPINACYCSSRLTASATSYFTTCISSLCTAETDPADLSSALSIYGRYCGTANEAQAAATTTSGSDSSSSTAGGGSSSSSSGGGGSGSSPSSAQNTGSTGSGSSTGAGAGKTSETGAAPAPSSSSGLTTTSKIALGVGLGVGIPLLAMAGAILVILIRRGGVGNMPRTGGMGGIEMPPEQKYRTN
ncbi:hypothetical protein TWF694_011514 [Orbilia ellipsospora]|uniref:Extracellular membrane protein CFEM domain-containing protein n=1 Tax=Orbilia ellipsospora TaxID=2528407 RepID=A0AAV9X5H2_9PEZI